MSIRSLLSSFALLAAVSTPVSAQQHNLLLIVADDLGVDYVGAYAEGTNPPPTPNIDALATSGVLFRNAWANPSCSPTRANILTGRYPFRTLVGRWIGHWANPQNIGLLHAHEWTIPEVLDAADSGYAHAMVGKWHLHDASWDPDVPRTIGGFSHFAGSLEGQIGSYTNWNRVVDGVTASTSAYCTTQNTDDALAWIQSQSGPWTCVLTYQAPHIPYHAPPAHLHTQNLSGLTPQSGHTPSNRPFYRAMVESLDTEMGRLFSTLGSTVLDDTNIVFIGDNGSVQQQAVAPFDPSRAKGTPYEGGINVPLIVTGPAVVQGGREVDALACAVDVFATTLELCSALDGLPDHVVTDSVSLVPYLTNPSQTPLRQFAYCEQFNGTQWPSPLQNGYAVIRNDRYKLIQRMTSGDELYDLQTDPWENNNLLGGSLSATQAQNHAALEAEIDALRSQPGEFVPYGEGACPGSFGTPQIQPNGSPTVGQTYSIQLSSAPPFQPAALLISFQDEHWEGVPLPIDLSLIGAAPGCILSSAGTITINQTTSLLGHAIIPISLAYPSTIVGQRLFHSWLVIDDNAPNNALGVTTTTAVAAVVGL